ncbi:MAG: methyltransferase domain-containing protein [Gammaproteobacteria bacterium]|nr:methyltransferase domain-containing protein [Gammaproteobacteria bacterium]
MENKLIENNLCCPVCKGGFLTSNTVFVCNDCELTFPCVQGRPILVPFVAEKGDGSDALLAAADSLPVRKGVPSVTNYQGMDVESIFFEKLFRQFNRRDTHWAFLGRKVSEMAEKIPKNATVLDIGAGECKYASLLTHARYVSADLVSSSDKHDFSLIDIVADASAIPFRDKVFDVALNLVVMEHVPDPALTVREMSRILKPGGLAFALIPLVRPEHLVPFDFQRFTRYGIQQLFENNGFQINSIEGSNGALWTAIYYASGIAKTQPLRRYGRRSIRGILWNRFWATILWPLVVYARMSDQFYGGEFPIYFWVQAVKKVQ